jgi:aspartyl/glutamyl-tRNA(Asn/Gln) amidotransferase C subunit
MSLDPAWVHRIARLACLRLEPAEEQRFGIQLGRVLEHVECLAAYEEGGTSSEAKLSSVAREDVSQPFPARAALLELAPSRHADFFVVPRVVSSTDG